MKKNSLRKWKSPWDQRCSSDLCDGTWQTASSGHCPWGGRVCAFSGKCGLFLSSVPLKIQMVPWANWHFPLYTRVIVLHLLRSLISLSHIFIVFSVKSLKHILLNLYCIMLFTLFYTYCLLIYFLTVASVLKHLMFVYCILYLTSMLKALRFCSTCKLTGLVHAGRRQENSRSGTKDSLFLTVLAVIRVSLLLQLPRPYSYWAMWRGPSGVCAVGCGTGGEPKLAGPDSIIINIEPAWTLAPREALSLLFWVLNKSIFCSGVEGRHCRYHPKLFATSCI